MIDDELASKVNEQIKHELQSEFYYLGMAAYFRDQDWNGFAHFMEIQANEEHEHAMKFYDFLDEVGKEIEIPSVEKPSTDYNSIVDVFETALEQEKNITESIHNLLDHARQTNSYEAESILQWFVEEQIEEENLMGDLLHKIRRAEGDEAALFMIDEELSEREDEE